MSKKFYVLGVGFNDSDADKSHPYEVWLDLQEKKYPIVMLEGKGASGVGGSFKPSEVLQEQWQEHIKISNTSWLLALLKDAEKNDDRVDYDLVLETYKHNFNDYPELKEFEN